MGTDGFRIDGVFNNGLKDERIICKWQSGKKEISADAVEYEKPTDHIGKYAAVMIAPDDMELINDGSELRRKWVDSILGQIDKQYLECLIRYQRVLVQRNAWLKQQAVNPSVNSVELDFYNDRLSQDGTYIYNQRKEFAQVFLPLLQKYYALLSGGREQVSIVYESDLLHHSLAHLLKEGLQHDLRVQRTLKGIHKDDFEFLLYDVAIKGFGSQGQKKSFLFALKLAQYNYLSDKTGHLPILLLDDVFEKLDQQRMESLLHIITNPRFGQVILTDTHAERVKAAFADGVEVGTIEL